MIIVVPVYLSGNISGRTYSTENQPLPFVAVVHLPSGEWCISDENGEFYLYCNSAQGDTISFSRIGYFKKQIVLNEFDFYTIHLQPANIQIADIYVKGDVSIIDETTASTSRSDLNRLSSRNWMKEIPGLAIRSYGSAASNLTITLNGGSAVHTKVLLENVDLTNPLMGQSDISQIPLSIVNKITVDNSPGVLYGSGAIDGSVNLKAKPTGSFFSYSLGSFGFQSFDFNWNQHYKKWAFDVGVGTFSEVGDFEATWRDEEIIRENNAMLQKYVFARFEGIFEQKYILNAYYLNTWQDRELAGQIYSPTPDATSDDELRIFSINLAQVTSTGYLRAKVNHKYSSLYYYNPWTTPFESHHFTQSDQLQLDSRLRLTAKVDLFINAELDFSQISSTAAGVHDRTTIAGAFSLNYQPQKWLAFAPAVRHDYSADLYGQSTFDLSLLIKPTNKISINYSGGTAFRYPTFSDMYWSYVGNPDLKAENSFRHSLTLKLIPWHNYYFALIVNDTDINNLIKWQPGNPYWRPVNIDHVHRTTLSLQAIANIGQWRLTGNYTFANAQDLEMDNAVRYSPKHSAYAALHYLRDRIQTGLQLRFTGEQIYIYDYPDDDYLDPYAVLSYSFHHEMILLGHTLKFDALIDNVLDTDYMNVYGYPEPGINFRIALIYEFN